MNRRDFFRRAGLATAGGILMPWGELWKPKTIVTVPRVPIYLGPWGKYASVEIYVDGNLLHNGSATLIMGPEDRIYYPATPVEWHSFVVRTYQNAPVRYRYC